MALGAMKTLSAELLRFGESKAMHVSVFGSALSGNQGAVAMFQSAVGLVRKSNPLAKVTLHSTYPERDRRANFDSSIQIVDSSPLRLVLEIIPAAFLFRFLKPLRQFLRKKVPALDALASSDLLLDQMGVSFMDGREKFLLYNVAGVLPALILGVPVVKAAQGMGPFSNPVNRVTARMILPRLHSIVARGDKTYQYLLELKLSNVYLGSDIVFSGLPNSVVTSSRLDGRGRSPASKDQTVVVAPSSVVFRLMERRSAGSYIELLVQQVETINACGYRAIVLPFSSKTDSENLHNNDIPICKKLLTAITGRDQLSVEVITSSLAFADAKRIIENSEFVVTSRFHAMVTALAVGTPPIVIAWGHKYLEVMKPFGLGHKVISQESVTKELIERAIVGQVSSLKSDRKAIEAGLLDARKRSEVHEKVIYEVFDVLESK